jgi:hypothetical protein
MYGIPIESYITKSKDKLQQALIKNPCNRYRYNKIEQHRIINIYRQVEQLKHN